MSDKKIIGILNNALQRVLEQSAFLFPDPILDFDAVALRSTELVRVSERFTGSRTGEVVLILPMALCGEICANMLGKLSSDDLPVEGKLDAAKELTNIVAGQLLTEAFGTHELFNQTAPEAEIMTPEQIQALLDEGDFVGSMVDQHPIIVKVAENDNDEKGEREQDHEHQSLNS